MNCEEAEFFLDAYVDGELELIPLLEFEKHQSGCSECQAALQERRQFRAFFNSAAPTYRAPPRAAGKDFDDHPERAGRGKDQSETIPIVATILALCGCIISYRIVNCVDGILW